MSFIGFSKDASERINAFDLDDETERYEWLFAKRPKTEHWKLVTLGPQVSLLEDNFKPLSPAPEQYLLSYIIYEFIKSYLPTPQSNKKQCEERLMGVKITPESSDEDKKTAMMDDHEYVLNQILYNMKAVIVELFCFILSKAYGHLAENTCRQILTLPTFRELVEKPDFRKCVSHLENDVSESKQNNILFTGVEFIKEAVVRWKSVNESQYKNAQRRIRFLHQAKTVESMKRFLNKTNEDTVYTAYQWKQKDTKFFDSLPKLSPNALDGKSGQRKLFS